MQLLKTEFSRVTADTIYRQITRTDKIALYEVQRGSNVKGYEIFKIKIAPAHTWPNGNFTPEHESYPGDGVFGKTAWYLPSLVSAQERFDELTKK